MLVVHSLPTPPPHPPKKQKEKDFKGTLFSLFKQISLNDGAQQFSDCLHLSRLLLVLYCCCVDYYIWQNCVLFANALSAITCD